MTKAIQSAGDVCSILDAEPTRRDLRELWAARARVRWLENGAEPCRAFVRRALHSGAFFLATDAARAGLRSYDDDLELRQGLAIALLRLGSVIEARRSFESVLHRRNPRDPDYGRALQLVGDCFYYEALAAGAGELRAADLRSSLHCYEQALDASPGEYGLATRAASVALLGGSESRDRALAHAARGLSLLERLDADGAAECSALVEKANALVVLGRFDDAAVAWKRAAAHAHATPHVLSRARAHARWLALAVGLDAAHYDPCFPPLRLAVFSGHLLDLPDAPVRRFAPEQEAETAELIGEALRRLAPCVAFSSAAAGADLLFLEAFERSRNGSVFERETHVVLPWARAAFLESSVTRHGAHWVRRFDDALAAADSVRELGGSELPHDVTGFHYTNVVMGGTARLLATAYGLDLIPVVVWNGEEGAPGGTGSFVRFWRDRGIEPTNVLDEHARHRYRTRSVAAEKASLPAPPSSLPPSGPNELRQRSARSRMRGAVGRDVKTMLFADVVGYSKLSETVIPAYVEHFLGLVSRLVAESPYPPISVNTWGDALYFVFDCAEDGGSFALDLADRIRAVPWIELGVFWEDLTRTPASLEPIALRTALHTGPVYVHHDPVVRRLGFTGAHVSRAARIEPIAPRHRIYASEEFAAVAATEGVDGFCCDFVGTMPLAKKYPGEFRLYELRRVLRFPLELVARAIHERYRRLEAARGRPLDSSPALREWDRLDEDLRAENRAQAAAIKEQVYTLGYTLVPSSSGLGSELRLTDVAVEQLARREHARWCENRRHDDQSESRVHRVDWDVLDAVARDKTRDAVRAIPELVRMAGFQVIGTQAG